MCHCKAFGSILFGQISLTSFRAEDVDILCCHPLKSAESSPECLCVCPKRLKSDIAKVFYILD